MRGVTPYQHIREGDMMWSKKIWRIIDLRQRINHPLYYPTEPQGGFDDRMSLIDLIIDNYFIILENLEDRIEDLEEKLVEEPTSETLHIIHLLKRDITFLRNSVWPLREVIKILEKGELSLIQEATKIYFRDVYDHTIWVIDTIERYREMITGMLDIYFSSVSDKMNKIMMFLTIIGTIFLPLTFITGIYGMNFRYMPELKWPWAYPSVLIFMFFISIGMLLYFKKKRWL